MLRISLVLAGLGALALGGGCDDEQTLPLTCTTDSQCLGEVCYKQKCLVASGDDDGDGLSNGVERQIGTDPLIADSDGDGIDDQTEVGQITAPVDSDGDGVPDALEAASGDLDSDCLPDWLDADDSTLVPDQLAALGCKLEGICSPPGLVKIACSYPDDDVSKAGTASCSYADVTGYEGDEETLCDDQDGDCDGATDEVFAELGAKCDGVDIDSCENGTWTCAADAAGVDCTNESVEGLFEICDGADNDCNGETDEGLTEPGESPVCCSSHGDCASLDEAATCDDPGACEGHRVEGQCDFSKSLCTPQEIPDASACGGC